MSIFWCLCFHSVNYWIGYYCFVLFLWAVAGAFIGLEPRLHPWEYKKNTSSIGVSAIDTSLHGTIIPLRCSSRLPCASLIVSALTSMLYLLLFSLPTFHQHRHSRPPLCTIYRTGDPCHILSRQILVLRSVLDITVVAGSV